MTENGEELRDAVHTDPEIARDAVHAIVSATGKVHFYSNERSWFEREEAERAASADPCVAEVIGHISSVP
jgi:hypothetical protein